MIWPLVIGAVLTIAGAAAKANAASKAAQQGTAAETAAGLTQAFGQGKGLRLNDALAGSGYPQFGADKRQTYG